MAKQGKGSRGLDRVDGIVLGTVNTPFRRSIDTATLADCLKSGEVGEWIVHLATFFTDVRPELGLDFARRHGIEMADLSRTYQAVKAATGACNPDLEDKLSAPEGH